MAKRGRPPMTPEMLKVTGSYRKDKHGHRISQTDGGAALPLAEVGQDAEWLHDLLTRTRPEWLDTTDSACLYELCEIWELLCAARRAAKKDPLDKFARTAYLGYHSAFTRLAAKYGLTPSDRASLAPSNPNKQEDELDRLIG